MMTREQLQTFLDNMLGFEELGVDRNGDASVRAICPEQRNFLIGFLHLKELPRHGYGALQDREAMVALADMFDGAARSLLSAVDIKDRAP